jgi:putative endonuclease
MSKDAPEAAHIRTGKTGETIAASFLEELGYRIIRRNVRVGRHDEIDLLAFDPTDRVLVFCEVKARAKKNSEYHPEINVTWRKRVNMARAARTWVSQHAWEGGYRMDTLYVSSRRVIDHHIDVRWPKNRS